MPGLWRRGTIFQYRVRVPADVATVLGRSHISRSLNTSSMRDARRALILTAYVLIATEM
ncbi:DUF6538 domain-containing protein [Novosphingobium barchaimii]|uniref:DUF6538 domain-containing protein n=1 Tax=Novosphingobium barchaimii TaxID=1420591 RepID=UPI0038B2F05D